MEGGGGNIRYMEIDLRVKINVEHGIFLSDFTTAKQNQTMCTIVLNRHKQNSCSLGQPILSKRNRGSKITQWPAQGSWMQVQVMPLTGFAETKNSNLFPRTFSTSNIVLHVLTSKPHGLPKENQNDSKFCNQQLLTFTQLKSVNTAEITAKTHQVRVDLISSHTHPKKSVKPIYFSKWM